MPKEEACIIETESTEVSQMLKETPLFTEKKTVNM